MLYLIFLWICSWVVGYSIFFILYKKTGEHEKYRYPGFIKKTIFISIFYSLIMFTVIQLLKILLVTTPVGVVDSFSCLTSVILAIFPALMFALSLRRPKHNQNEKISIPLGCKVSELLNLASNSFPDIPKGRLWVHRGINDVMDRTLSVLPDPTEWRSGSVVVGPIVSLDRIEYLAKKMDGKTEEVCIDYENGDPFLYSEK